MLTLISMVNVITYGDHQNDYIFGNKLFEATFKPLQFDKDNSIECSDHKAVSVIECETRNNEDAEWLYKNVLPHGNCRRQGWRQICGFLSRSTGDIICGENIESAVVNALDAKKEWLEAYFQNSDCEVILTQL